MLTSEIEALPDLTGYLKKPSSPEWWRVAIVPLPSLGIASPTGTDGEAEALTPLPEPVPDDLRSAVGAEGGVEASLGTKKNPAGEADGVS